MTDNSGKSKIDLKTILNSVFLILLAISGGYSDKLLGCKLQKLLDSNIYAKHIMLLSIIFFTYNFTQEANVNPLENMKIAVFIWFMVILVNKMNIYYTLTASAILAALYLNNIYIKYYETLENKNKDMLARLDTFDNVMKYVFIVVIIFGSVEYFIKKRSEYNNTWNTLTYIFGVVKCKNT